MTISLHEIEMLVGKIVKVEWIDPTGSSGGWHEPEEALGLRPVPCVTYGILLKVGDGCVILAGSGNLKDDEPPEWGDINALPLHCVKGVSELHERPRRIE